MADKTPRRRTPVSRAPVARPRKLAGQRAVDPVETTEPEPPSVEPVETTEPSLGLDRLDQRDPTPSVQPSEGLDRLDQRDSTPSVEPSEGLDRLDQRDSTPSVEPSEGLDRLDQRDPTPSVEPSEGLGRLDQRDSTPSVEPVETTEPEPPPVEPVETSRSRTAVLVVLLVVLLVAAAGEAWYLWLRDDPTISASRPVVVSPVAAAGTADTAARALVEIVSTSYEDYDEQTEAAAGLMTPAFAKEYRQTAADVRDSIVEDQAEVSVTVLQQAVVTASPQQVQALIFFDQTVAKNGTGPGVTPYRALVTVVRSGDRWLVSAIDTQ